MKYQQIAGELADKLKYYVYAYIDPRNNSIFYIGKGKNGRALSHLDDTTECEKTRRIAELATKGREPRIDIIAHGMKTEEAALRVEAALIDVLLPGSNLTNRVRGIRSLQFGRVPLSELQAIYTARPVTVKEPALLIRISRLYRPEMGKEALYEATRGVWKVGTRRGAAKYALAVFEGVVRQVYHIDAWHPAGTTPYTTRTTDEVTCPGRWEFTGTIARDLAATYNDRSVRKYFVQGAMSPVVYVNC